jgi:hypothetical protein
MDSNGMLPEKCIHLPGGESRYFQLLFPKITEELRKNVEWRVRRKI